MSKAQKKSASPVIVKKGKDTNKPSNFYDALKSLVDGAKIRRLAWPTNEYALLKDGFLSIHRDNQFHRWLVNDGDILATDWVTDKN